MIHETGETGGRRARIRAERADEIVAAAWEIVRAEGLESLTTHALAARLELAVGALYRYFPSKAALVAELERRALVALGEALGAALAGADGGLRGAGAPLARLCLLGLTYGRFARERAAEFALLGQMLANPRVLLVGAEGAGPTAAALGVLDVAARAFAEAAEAGALPPGDALERAALFGAGLRGALELGKLRAHDARVDGPTLADAMARALLAGFGAEPAALTRAFTAARRQDERSATEAAR